MVAFLSGIVLGLSLAAPPGPVSALMADSTLRRGPLAGSLVGLGATTADFVFFLLAWAGAVAVLADRPVLRAFLALAGAALLVYYAVGAWRSTRDPVEVQRVAPATFATGFVAAATSPFNLAWWVGPGSVLIASVGVVLVAGMFTAILVWVGVVPYLFAHAGRRIRSMQRVVSVASAAVLLAFAVLVAIDGVRLLQGAAS